MSNPRDLKETASTVAIEVNDTMFEAHRGAFRHLTGVLVVFGNDGYSGNDQRSRKEVEFLRVRLAELQVSEMAFATDSNGYTWVMLVEPNGDGNQTVAGKVLSQELLLERLTTAVWDAWDAAVGSTADKPLQTDYRQCQMAIAESVIPR